MEQVDPPGDQTDSGAPVESFKTGDCLKFYPAIKIIFMEILRIFQALWQVKQVLCRILTV